MGLVVLVQCEGVVIARLESPLGAEEYLIELSPEAYDPERICIARTLVQDQWEISASHEYCLLRSDKKGSSLAHCGPVMLVTPFEAVESQTQKTVPQLQDVIVVTRPNLHNGELQESEELITKYEDVFAMKSSDYRQTNRAYHRIDAEEARPIQQPLRRLPMVKQVEVDKMLQDMQQLGVIDESNNSCSSPIGLIQKKNLDHCFCIDCRKLNDVTRENCFPLPRIDVTLDMLTRAKWLSIQDLKSGYWQVALYPDHEKTALSTGQGLWQFTVMPFSLCCAPVTVRWLM
jgi:hypothetical protein